MITDKFSFVEKRESSAAERKASLRTYMKRRRGENENRDIKESLLVENFFAGGFAEKESFFVYLSFSSEAPTDKLIERLTAAGKRIYAPRVEGKEMAAVPLGQDFTLSPYGIREPLGSPWTGSIDVAVVPLLAADEQGNRLGYGGGYYDKFLKARPETLAVGWCFDFQLVKEVPREAFDEKIDYLVTDKRLIMIKKEV